MYNEVQENGRIEEMLKEAYKPYDVVTKDGNTGFITEVGLNLSGWFVHYSVCWIVGDETICAWFSHNELEKHCNMFVKIAETSCGAGGGNSRYCKKMIC